MVTRKSKEVTSAQSSMRIFFPSEKLTCSLTYPTLSPEGTGTGMGVKPIPAYSLLGSSSPSTGPIVRVTVGGVGGKGKEGWGVGGRGLSWIQLPLREPIPPPDDFPSGTGRAGKGLRDKDSWEGRRGRPWACKRWAHSSRERWTRDRRPSDGGAMPTADNAGSRSDRRAQAC